MKSLKEIGFTRGWVYEIIVENTGGHAAPMGVWSDDGVKLKLSVYNTSNTCAKVRKEKEFRLFFPSDWVSIADCLKSRKVDENTVSGFLDCAVVGEEDDGIQTTFECEVTGGGAQQPLLLNRAQGLFAELLVESTKPGRNIGLMKKYYEKIRRVAPDSEYTTLGKQLL